MLNDVKSYAFDDLLSNIVDNRGKTCPVVNDGLPLIATNCVKNETLYPAFEKVRYVSNETYQNWFRGHPKPDDIIFVCKGAPGNVCWTPDPVNFCIAQDMVAIRANEDIIDSKYLFALLRSPESQSKILNMHVGTMIPHFKKGDFKNLYFDIPTDKFLQKAIGEIYFKFCERIELNRQINETLESMAQALFKSWFVDFDPVIDNALVAGNTIPDVFAERAKQRAAAKKTENQSTSATAVNDSSDYQYLFPAEFEFTEEMGWIPLGWEVGLLGGFATFGNGKKSPERSTGEIPVFGSNGMIGVCDEFNRDGTIIVGRVGSYCGSLQYYPSKCWITDNAMSAEMHDKECNIYLFQLLTRDNLNDRRAGSGQPLINQSILRSIVTVIPNKASIKEYSAIGNNLYRRKQSLSVSSQNLAKLRDTLLPKLLSGELRIPDAEKLVQEAML